VQLELFLRRFLHAPPATDWLDLGPRRVRLCFQRNRRARRYILRVTRDGWARVTIPRTGSETEARAFAQRHREWLRKQLERQAAAPPQPPAWQVGSQILFRGQLVPIESSAKVSPLAPLPTDGQVGLTRVSLGESICPVASTLGDLRPALQHHLRRLAERELPARVVELAARWQLPVRRVLVRNQRTRWGSCSRRGTISLNWRLVQTPSWVSDYLIIHELMHLRQMNHSREFWREVGRACPGYAQAERWLKQNAQLLRD
jgi:predicted metal-dependent hydrolase